MQRELQCKWLFSHLDDVGSKYTHTHTQAAHAIRKGMGTDTQSASGCHSGCKRVSVCVFFLFISSTQLWNNSLLTLPWPLPLVRVSQSRTTNTTSDVACRAAPRRGRLTCHVLNYQQEARFDNAAALRRGKRVQRHLCVRGTIGFHCSREWIVMASRQKPRV